MGEKKRKGKSEEWGRRRESMGVVRQERERERESERKR